LEFHTRALKIHQRLLFRLPEIPYIIKDCKRKRQRLHELQINRKQQLSNYQLESKKVLQSLTTAHVRWPAKNSGAFVFGCPFLCFFLLGKQKKEKKWRYVPNFSNGATYRQAVQINTGIIFAPQH